jgi:hypothetical protein
MDEFGISPPATRDPFGMAYARMMRAAPPPAPMPMPVRPSPMMETPRISTMRYMGMPQARPRMLMDPAMALAGRMPAASNVLPFSPARAPEQPNTLARLTPADITNIVRQAESSGNYQALNREQAGNTASGAYQYTDGTWNGYGGYAKAMYAPPEVQDRRFAEDLTRRFEKYGGDPFKIIAEHYLPAYAGRPETWTQPVRLKSGTVRPVASYIRQVIKGTPLEAEFDAYLRNNQNR